MKYIIIVFILFGCSKKEECQMCKHLKEELRKANTQARIINRLLNDSNVIIISDNGYKLTKADD